VSSADEANRHPATIGCVGLFATVIIGDDAPVTPARLQGMRIGVAINL